MSTNSHTTAAVRYRGFPLGPFETNCYVVWVEGAEDCWIVDASYEPDVLIDFVRSHGLRPVALVLTHAHMDHIAGIPTVRGAFPGMPVWVHRAEERWLEDAQLNLSAFAGMPVTAPSPDATLEHGQPLELAGSEWRVLHTPGHSPGGITLICASAGLALVGDALFAGSVGRTDFPGCSFGQLQHSIRTHLYTLPDETRVLPGHGPETTIGREKQANPFVRP